MKCKLDKPHVTVWKSRYRTVEGYLEPSRTSTMWLDMATLDMPKFDILLPNRPKIPPGRCSTLCTESASEQNFHMLQCRGVFRTLSNI